jgi:hypothetical protein
MVATCTIHASLIGQTVYALLAVRMSAKASTFDALGTEQFRSGQTR